MKEQYQYKCKKNKRRAIFFFVYIKYNGDNMSKETFKSFARNHPELAKQVLNNKVSWQKLYELYEIYGEDNSIWNDFITTNNYQTTITTFKDLFTNFKSLDLDSVQKGITNLQKTLGLLQELGVGQRTNQSLQYEPKPLFRYFED